MAKTLNWTRREHAVVNRYARNLGRGRYHDALDAAKACRQELERVWKAHPGLKPRTLPQVQSQVRLRGHALGARWASQEWNEEEKSLLLPFAQAYLRGDYPSVRAAARACHEALPARVRRQRTAVTVYHRLFQLARARGLPRLTRATDSGEAATLDRYVRALHRGRYRYVRDAAPDCLAELRRRRDGRDARPRTLTWVELALHRRSAATGLPRYRNFLTPTERRLLELYARTVDRGELPDWLTAARECLAEIRRHYARPPRRGTGGPRRLTSHSLHTIHTKILNLAHRLNLRGPRCIRWSANETKLLNDWLKWFVRYRSVRRLTPLKQASEGLQQDLAGIGSTRTLGACRNRLLKHCRLMHGMTQ